MKIKEPFGDNEVTSLVELLNSFDDVDTVEVMQRTQKELERFYCDDNRIIRKMEFQDYRVSVYVRALSVDIVF